MYSAVVSIVTVILLFGPILLTLWASFAPEAGMILGFTDISLRWYRELFASRDFVESFVQSLYIALVTTVFATILGTSAAYALGRFRFRGREAVSTVLLSPLMIPGVAIGLSLNQFLSELGMARGYTALFIGHVVITVPYVARTVGAALVGVDRNLEYAAWDLGASKLRAFALITLPLLRPGLVAGALFTFITSFDELTISLFLSGTRIVPLPVRIFTYLETVVEPTAAAASAILVVLSVVTILLVEKLVGLDRILGADTRR